MSQHFSAQILFLALLLNIAVLANAEEGAGYNAPIVQGLIKIEDKRLVYKGKSVSVPYTRKKLIEVFGKPSREIYNSAGTVVIWDELGLSCYGCQEQEKSPEEFQFMTKEEKKNIKHQKYVDSITIFVRKYNPYPDRENKYSHEPRYPFQGKLELDGVELDGTQTFYEFVESRKGKQTILLPENSFSFFIRCKPEPHEVTLHTIRDKYNDDYMSVYSVSIRNIGHYYKNIKCAENFSVAPRPTDPNAEEPVPENSGQQKTEDKKPEEKDSGKQPEAATSTTEESKFPQITPEQAPEPIPESIQN